MRTANQNERLVSVLMPAHNSPDIYASVDSVLNQTYGPIQFILIDDCSSEFSLQSMETYLNMKARSNIQSWIVLKNEQNLGTVKTLNRGLSIAQGEIIFNLAGDDLFCDERVLEDWVREFQKTQALVITGIRQNYDHEFQNQMGVTPTIRQVEWLKTLTPDSLFEKLILDHFVAGASTARSRQFFQKYGLYDENYRLIEDFPANLRFLRDGGRIVFFDREVIKYRGGGMSSVSAAGSNYERDMRLIFQNEIYPYTRYPKRAKRWLRNWENDIAFDRKYVAIEQLCEKRVFRRTLLRVWYYAHHPIQAIRKLSPSSLCKEGKQNGNHKTEI